MFAVVYFRVFYALAVAQDVYTIFHCYNVNNMRSYALISLDFFLAVVFISYIINIISVYLNTKYCKILDMKTGN